MNRKCVSSANVAFVNMVKDFFTSFSNLTDEEKEEGKRMLIGAAFIIFAMVQLMFFTMGATWISLDVLGYTQNDNITIVLTVVGMIIGAVGALYLATVWEYCYGEKACQGGA